MIWKLSELNKLHQTLLRYLPAITDLEALDSSFMQKLEHCILSNSQNVSALTQCHDFGYVFVHGNTPFLINFWGYVS